MAAQGALAATNPIVLENQQQGTTSWQFTNYAKATRHEIEGYASLASVDQGGQISFMVSTSASAQYNMDIYRMGWYPNGTNPDGSSCSPSCGGRLMQHVGPLTGSTQATCPTDLSTTDPTFGMTECHWTPSYTLTVPTSWTTGVYLVKLTRLDDGLQNYMIFVVRDDADNAPVAYSLDVNTWQAYNYWGGAGNGDIGYDLYGKFNDVTQNNINSQRAYTVSFDRPYMVQGSMDGAGTFFNSDFPMVRWMESQGYNIDYMTDVDLDQNPSNLLQHRMFANVGHDEYYSDNMRNALKNAIASGVNMAFFSANDIYQRIVMQSDYSGVAGRRVFDDKGAFSGSTTGPWRYLSPPQPENAIQGVMSNGISTNEPWLIHDASSWIFAGTGLVNYTGSGTGGIVTSGPGQNALPGIVGYEFDENAVNDPRLLSPYVSYEPSGLDEVGHSYVPAADNGVQAWSDATLYTAPSGATVFSAGTMEWSFTLDNGYNDGFCDCGTRVANAAGQKITANIFNRFTQPLTAPAVTLSPTSLTYGNQQLGLTSGAQSITLTNSGNAPLSFSGIAITGTNSSDFGQTNTCPTGSSTLAAGASCTISVTFTPTATGSRSASLQITDDALDSPESVTLSGTGTAPAVTLNPTGLTFGSQLVGTTSAGQSVTVTNSGTAPLTIASIGLTGTNAGDFAQTNTCPASPSTLAAGASCTISVTFTPTAAATRTAGVQITDNASDSPETEGLTGTGAARAPVVSLSPGGLTFGNQQVGTTTGSQPVTLTNTGTAPLSITGIAISGTNSSDFGQTNTCPISPSTLAAGASCTVTVTFTPTAAGARSAGVQFTDNAGDSPESVGLSGTGIAPAVTLNPSSLTFGSQLLGTTSAAKSVTLTNSGTAPLAITKISLSGNNAADFAQTNTCPISPSTLATGATCSISVTFSPSSAGSRSASVQITDNASDSPESVGLSGTGQAPAPAVTLSPGSLSFGSQLVGTTSGSQAVTLTNTGTAPLSISTIAIAGSNPGDFGQTNTCPTSPSTLAVGASCSITVTFTPTAGGSRSGSVQVTDNAGDSPESVTLSGTGTAPAVTFNPTSLTFHSQLQGTKSAAQSVTLTNSGTAPLTISNVSLSGSNPGDFAQTNTCPATPSTLATGSSCTISVTFTPSATGTRTATLNVTDNAPDSPQGVGLTGTGSTSAIAFDQSLGQFAENASATSIPLTTTAAAASNSRVFVFVDWYSGSGTLSSVSGGGLTWSVDVQKQDTTGYRTAIASANAPSGLPSGTVITANFSASSIPGLIAAASFTGIATTSPVDATNSNLQNGAKAWTGSVSTSNASDLIVGWSGMDAGSSITNTATAPNTEIFDFGNIWLGEYATAEYQIVTATGSQTVNGTWSGNPGSTANSTVVAAYKSQ